MKKFKSKNRVIRTATKRTQTSVCPPTQCAYIPNPLCAVYTAKWTRDVSALCWRSYTCSCPFCGSPNHPAFTLKFLNYLSTFKTLHDAHLFILSSFKFTKGKSPCKLHFK